MAVIDLGKIITTVDSELSPTSENPVQNKILHQELARIKISISESANLDYDGRFLEDDEMEALTKDIAEEGVIYFGLEPLEESLDVIYADHRVSCSASFINNKVSVTGATLTNNKISV